MGLGYYRGDYQNQRNNMQRLSQNTDELIGHELYNGNIAAWSSNVQESELYLAQGQPRYRGLTGQQYRYDELNRLVSSDMQRYREQQWQGTNQPGEYSSSYRYDASGNLLSLERNAYGRNPLMDRLQYRYRAGTNQLDYVTDAANHPQIQDDFRPDQVAGNYHYDAIGNLTKDEQEGITDIAWTVYGKVQQVIKEDGTTVSYGYDASGNRISKQVTTPDDQEQTTYYVRDASGQVMAIYERQGEELRLTEQPIYGSDRVGMYRADQVVEAGPVTTSEGKVAYVTGDISINSYEDIDTYVLAEGVEMTVREGFEYSYAATNTEFSIYFGDVEQEGQYYARVLGKKQYELKDHLGNNLVSVSDRRDGEGNAVVLSATDYYAFGKA